MCLYRAGQAFGGLVLVALLTVYAWPILLAIAAVLLGAAGIRLLIKAR
jgi:hypothetical protein